MAAGAPRAAVRAGALEPVAAEAVRAGGLGGGGTSAVPLDTPACGFAPPAFAGGAGGADLAGARAGAPLRVAADGSARRPGSAPVCWSGRIVTVRIFRGSL